MAKTSPRTLRARFAAYREAAETRLANALPSAYDRPGRAGARVRWREVADWLPAHARDDNFRRVTQALDAAGVTWWVVSGLHPTGHVIGVDLTDRRRALRAIAADEATAECYVRDPEHPAIWIRAPRMPAIDRLAKARLLQVGVPTRCRGLVYGLNHGCEVEFWSSADGRFTAPRENRAASRLSAAEMELVEVCVAGRTASTPIVFNRRMVDDVTFDIDVVYTWVDGADPAWRSARNRALAEQAGAEYHPSATDEARFRSRDELRYSLRSIAMYAPWVRRIFLVTNGQMPGWLRPDHPKLEVVPHTAIYDGMEDLPTFNSNSIISRLHHIPGLGEHYLYFNDDVFLGAPVQPADFFTPSGLAKVFPSGNRRPFGHPHPDEPTHLNLTHNIRMLLEREFGITVSRAIWHTPHAQLRSVHEELERRFADEYARTRRHRFRHHTDIVADQLHHYYAQITGRAVPGRIRYAYVALEDAAQQEELEQLARTRDRQTFCLNDAPHEDAAPIPDDQVRRWLSRYFPIPSDFER